MGPQSTCKAFNVTSKMPLAPRPLLMNSCCTVPAVTLGIFIQSVFPVPPPKPYPTVYAPSFKSHTGCYVTLKEIYYIKRCLRELSSNELPDKELEVTDNCHLANRTVML